MKRQRGCGEILGGILGALMFFVGLGLGLATGDKPDSEWQARNVLATPDEFYTRCRNADSATMNELETQRCIAHLLAHLVAQGGGAPEAPDYKI